MQSVNLPAQEKMLTCLSFPVCFHTSKQLALKMQNKLLVPNCPAFSTLTFLSSE